MYYNFKQVISFYGKPATIEVDMCKDEIGFTIESDITSPNKSGKGVYVHQCVIAVLPDEEAIKLRDKLIAMYPLVHKELT